MGGRKRPAGISRGPGRNSGDSGTHFIATSARGAVEPRGPLDERAMDVVMRESGAETYMRCRLVTHAKASLLPRHGGIYGEGLRAGYGLRFIREFNESPYIKARDTVCR